MSRYQHQTFYVHHDSHNATQQSTANLTTMLCEQADQTQNYEPFSANHNHQSNQIKQNYQTSLSQSSSPELNRIKDQHRHQIRIRYVEQIKNRRRKQQLTNRLIEEILSIQLPKESGQCKDWSENIMSLLNSQNSYVFKAYELLDIFKLAQRFPNISTLRLFRIAINKTQQTHIKQLMNVDIFKFFHNLLQFPGVKNIQSKINPETVWQNHAISYYTQPLNVQQQSQKSQKQSAQNVNAYFIQLDTVKNVILALGQLYEKSPQMRKFSIQTHNTYEKVLTAFRTYKQDIKSQFIEYLLMTTQRESYPNYNQNYVKIVKMTCELVMFYKYRFNFQMLSQKQEDQTVIKGTQFRRDSTSYQKHEEFLAEKLKRSSILIKTLRIFLTNKLYFMRNILQSQNTKHNFLDVAIIYLKYGKLILNIAHQLNEQQYQNFSAFVKQTLTFLCYFDDKMLPNQYTTGNIDGYREVIQILAAIRQKHQLLDNRSKYKNNQFQRLSDYQNQNYQNFEKIRNCCYFTLSNAIHSVVECMPNQLKNIIFFTKPMQNPNCLPRHFNLIQQIDYWFFAQLSMVNQRQLIILMLSIFKLSFIQQVKNQIKRFNLVQKLLQKSGDSFISCQDRIFILNQLSQFIERLKKEFSCEQRVYFLQIIYTNCQRLFQRHAKLDFQKQEQPIVYPFIQALLGQAQMQLAKYS